MRKFYLLLLFVIVSFIGRAQVSVTATAGTTGPTPYTTLKGAFDAINAGTHQGAINISLSAGTTETATAALNASGGTASYTSVNITATTPVTVTGSFTGAIIKLNGADNVTIDGRIGGTGRNITVSSTSTAAASAAIWLSSTGAGAGCTNNTIRNLELACGATQNTVATATYGIIMNGAAISTTSDGNDNDNNTFTENRIIRSRYGIVTRGVSTNFNQTVTITNNIIGPASFGTDEIGKAGVFMQYDNNATISSNTIQYVGGDFANTSGGADRAGIAIGVENWASAPTTLTGSNYTITRNTIHDIIEERTFSAVGVLLSVTNGASATNNLVANNFIYNLKANGTAGDAGVGIGIGAGNGDNIVFNSVRMSGDLDPNGSATTPSQTNCCLRVANTPTNLTVKNNILYIDVFSSSAAALNSACIMIPSASFAWGTGGLNNNDYYYPAANTTARTGATGTVSLATGFFTTLANWQAALTPAQDNSSKAVNPNFTSATDLHIPTGSSSELESAGVAAGGVTVDIDNDARPGPAGSINGGGTAPDIGADEFDAIPIDLTAPGITYTALTFTCNTADRILSNVTITDGSGVPTSGGNVPRVYYRKNAGTWYSQAGSLSSGNGINGAWTFVIVAADMGGLAGGDVVQYYVIAQDVATTPNIGSNPSGVTATNVNTVSVHPASPNSFTISTSLSGTYAVGAGQTYTTLTAAVAAYNTSCLTGPVVFQLTDATYPGETFPIVISSNPDASVVNTLTINPAAGVTATITGSNATAIIKPNGADYVTIDGSNNGTTSRDLTFENTNTGTSSMVLWIGSASGTNGVTNFTVKNCITKGNAPGTTFVGIFSGSGVTAGGIAEGPTSNIVFQNNNCIKSSYGIALAGNTGIQTGTVVTSNVIGSSTATDFIGFRGIFLSNNSGATVSKNSISNIVTTSGNPSGVYIAANVTNSTFDGNVIDSIRYTGTGGFGGKGFDINTSNPASNLTISNNMISRMGGDGWSSLLGDAIVGIRIGATGGVTTTTGGIKLYYNTVKLGGSFAGSTSGTASAAVYISSTASAIDLRNNILMNTLDNTAVSTDKAWAINAAGTNAAFTNIDYNDYYVSGAAGILGFLTADQATLAAIQTAFGSNVNSKNILPVFTAANDLHLVTTSNTSLNNLGTPISGITIDIDNDTRDAATPDMGADEFAPPPCTAVAGATVATPTGPFCAPGATVLSLSGAGIGTGTSYQWQTSPDGVSWTDSAGQTSATMTVTGLMASRWYQCMVGCTATGTFSSSTPVQIVVTAGPTAAVTPIGPIYLCSPSTQLLSVATNAATPSYQWKLGGGNIGGATTSSYTVTASGTYTVTVTDAATTCATTSNGVVVGIEAPPTAPVISPSTTTMCEGAAPVQISITSGGVTTGTVSFGTQAAQNTSTPFNVPANYPAPYTVLYGGQRMQMLITASELSAAGLAAGPISNIYFPVVSLGANWGGTLTSCQGFQVSMGLTSLTTISAFQTGLTQVVAPANFTPAVGYANTHTVATPFSWDGTSNLIIETTFSNNITGLSGDAVIQYNSPTSYQSCIVYRSDGVTAAAAAAATTVTYSYNARPDFRINGARIGSFTWAPTTGLYTDALGTIPYTGLAASTVYAQPAAGTTVYTATSCSTSGTATVDVTSPTSLAAVAGGPQRCNTSTVSPAGTLFHFGGACGLIAKVVPSGSPAVSGSVDACVKIDASVQTDPYNVPYVTRHYDITPATGAATAQAQITLYFLQSEFDDFNTYVTTNALPFPPLPTGGVDNGNIKITQFHGTGTVPGNYTGAPELIVPAGVVWNAVKGWWEITFPVAGFSGFYLHSGSKSLLPVPFNALRLSAALTGETNTIYWTTETEENNKKFIIERSADGRNFSAVGELNSRAPGGNSNAPISYSFVDQRPINGKQYYRLRLISLTGGEQLTQIVSLRRGSPGIEFASVRPNPTSGMVYLNINGTNNEVTMVVRNMEGKEVLRSVKQPNMEFTINISSQPSGVYVLEATDTKTGLKALFKLVKQ